METVDYENSLMLTIEETFRCRNCNYCYSRCPLFETWEGLLSRGPSGITQSIYYMVKWNLEEKTEELLDVISKCTTCNSCVQACEELAAGIPITDIILSGRALLVENGKGPKEIHAQVLDSIYEKGNSYGENPNKKKEWLKSLNIKNAKSSSVKNLLYLGCSLSFDPKLQKIAEAFIAILKKTGIDFGVAYDEPCCGCITKRIGDIYFFDEIVQNNTEYFNELEIEKIITISPHAYNTFKKEYKNINKPIVHYTQFLYELIEKGILKLDKKVFTTATYHDPCYLGKHNGVYEEPRKIITSIPGVKLKEMKLNKKFSFCCGGGGGGMWLENEKKNRRLSNLRIQHAIETGSETLVVACPWCYSMLSEESTDKEIEVIDIAQLIQRAIS